MIALIFLLVMLNATIALADNALPEPNWTAESAHRAAQRVVVHEALQPLFELARSGQKDELLERLRLIATQGDLPLPAREKILFQFAVGLGDLPVDSVSPTVLGFLLDYDSRTLLPHEDHQQYGVPLYNVRAAAAGAIRSWERRAAATEATKQLSQGTQAWLQAYLSGSETQRRGFEDALAALSPDQLRRLAGNAVSLLPGNPEITPIVAECAALLADADLFSELIQNGEGPSLANALRNASVLDLDEQLTLLSQAVLEAPATNAALAMARLAPELLHQRDAEDLLFALLGNADLGAAAALILSRSENPVILARLAETAKQTAGLSSTRARLATALAGQNRGIGEQ